MKRVFGIGALIGLLVAEAMAVAGIAGIDIGDRCVRWLVVFSMGEFTIAMITLVLVSRPGRSFFVPREVSAGWIAIVLVIALAALAPGHLAEGRPVQVGARYVAEGPHREVLRALSAEEFRRASNAESAVGCAMMAVFLYIATLRLLVPARAWSARRERRWGDLMGVETNISKVSIGT